MGGRWGARGGRGRVCVFRHPPPPSPPPSAHPIAPSAAAAALKAAGVKGPKHKRASTARGAVTWVWREFDNPARPDGLRLSHWTKCLRPPPSAPPGTAPAPAANVRPRCLRYDDEEWGAVVPASPSWTRAETDYLLDMLDAYGQRFVVVADRYKVRRRERGRVGFGEGVSFFISLFFVAAFDHPPPPPLPTPLPPHLQGRWGLWF